ncbi:MAG: hypothetical protein ACJ8EI_01715 [Sphingomicrobium sp.]
MKTSTIFKSRWMALIWAAGILWLAWDVAGSAPQAESSNAAEPTDATGAPITPEQEKQFEQALNQL